MYSFGHRVILREKNEKIVLCILGVTIITTFSTTGQIFLCFLIFCAMWNTKNKKYKFLKFLLLTLMLLVIPFVINWILQDKVSSSSGEGSVSARSYDIQKCIQIGLDNLFLVNLYLANKIQTIIMALAIPCLHYLLMVVFMC